MAGTRRPQEMEEVIDHQKLRELRRRAGLTLKQVEDLTGISASTLCNFERGRLLLPWPRLKKLLQLYRIDLLELQELLCLRLLDAGLLQDFRRACRHHQTTPEKALEDFMRIFIALARGGHGND